MSLGFPVTKQDLDGRAGQLAVTLRDVLGDVQRMKVWLDGRQDSDLTTLGYSAGEVTKFRAALTDLDNLRKVATAQQAQPAANDFFFNARDLMGLL